MKILVFGGEGMSTRAVVNALVKEYQDIVLIEEKKESVKELIKKRIKKLGLLKVIGQIVFVVTIPRLLNRISKKRISEIKDKYKLDYSDDYIRQVKYVSVYNINDDITIEEIEKNCPDIIVVNGTRIISKRIIDSVKIPMINMHVGITPKYRGVHGGYWAMANEDPEHCGVTIHMIAEGIDTGDVIRQKVIETKKSDNYVTYPMIQTGEGIKLEIDTINEYFQTGCIATRKVDLESKLWYHPTIFEYLVRIRNSR